MKALEEPQIGKIELNRETRILSLEAPANWRGYLRLDRALSDVAWPLQMFSVKFLQPAKCVLAVEPMLQSADVRRIRECLSAVRGVRQVDVDPRGGAVVFYDRSAARIEAFEERVEELGYKVEHKPSMADMEEDRRYSETSHRVAGIFLFLMGFLLIVELPARRRPAWFSWSVPLLFILPAAWILVAGDTDAWPYAKTLSQTITNGEIVAHKMFSLVLLILGISELQARRGRLSPRVSTLLFSGIALAGCALLLLHRHASFVPEHQRVADIQNAWHAAFAMVGLVIAGARCAAGFDWIRGKAAPYLYPAALQILALLLIFYREG